MKNKRIIFLPIALFALALPSSGVDFFKAKEVVEPDDIEYKDSFLADYNKPDVVYLAPKKAVESATAVSIHYHNDDAQCGNRELWVWADGVVGTGYSPTSVSSDKKDMTVNISFTGENAKFAKKKGIYFIVKTKNTWLGQSENMYVSYEEFAPENGTTTVWCVPGEGNAIEMYHTEAETKMDRFQYASFSDWKTIKVIATAVPQTYRLYALTSNYMSLGSMATQDDLNKYLVASGSNPTCTSLTYNSAPAKQFNITLNFTAKVNVQYYLEGIFPEYSTYTKTKYVNFTDLYETARFKQYYEYTGNDLGVTLDKANNKTTFKVWAPTAARVRLMLYKSGTPSDYDVDGITGNDDYSGYNMVFQPGGIWAITFDSDLSNSYYNYYVVNSLGRSEATDPYAKACGVNGKRGMVCDFSTTNPSGWDNVPLKWDGVSGYDIKTPNELSIYETHIRDLTMDDTWTGTSTRGTYSAFIESGTTYTSGATTVKTGFDHLTEMNVKAVQLEPVFDSDNNEGFSDRTYNWGYNPLNYNCVDGSYASNPYAGAARIREFKQLVQAFANNGNHTRVIMDVVYNHVSSAPASCFNKLMPKYYFRYEKTTQTYYDGSGCGNEVKTEAPMMSKYIVDSLCWWASEYKIKGFRFDLMGLIDWQTMKKAAQELYKIDPDIYLYGEGWTGDGSDAHIENTNASDPYYGNWGSNTWTVYNKLGKDGNMCYIGAFNDAGRNALKGGNNIDTEGWGFIGQGSSDVGDKSNKVADLLAGYHSDMNTFDPNQCVNYASCHDNYTLFDQLTYTIGQSGANDFPGVPCAGTIACEATIMASNGVAFIHGGEELFRTKVVTQEDIDNGNAKESDTHVINGTTVSHNSYNLSDKTNAYKWDRKIKINGVVTLDYVKQLQKAVKAHNELPKYNKAFLNANNPWISGNKLNYWGRGDGATTVALQNDQYFFFVAGANSSPISFTGITTYNKQVFCSNPKSGGYSAGSDSITLGWYTCVMLTK